MEQEINNRHWSFFMFRLPFFFYPSLSLSISFCLFLLPCKNEWENEMWNIAHNFSESPTMRNKMKCNQKSYLSWFSNSSPYSLTIQHIQPKWMHQMRWIWLATKMLLYVKEKDQEQHFVVFVMPQKLEANF